MIAALFVETGGCYYGLPNVDPWDQTRDARQYNGPHKVIAHPPCARWGRLWYMGGGKKGDDGGCFAKALSSVRTWGGVLEHPAHSSAWAHFGLGKPAFGGGWVQVDDGMGWTCEVEQGHYDHRARKRTWLYAAFCPQLELIWGPSNPEPSVNSTPQILPPGRRASRTGICQRMSKKQRMATPIPFRDILISIVSEGRR